MAEWDWYGFRGFRPHVTVATKRARANAALAGLSKRAGKKGRAPEPVRIEGHKIARTFWGKAWCENLESYADFAHRLERGRSYVRAGAVVDLQIEAGKIAARVAGTELYTVEIGIAALGKPRWKTIASACAGKVGSLVALLRGEFPDAVMHAVTDRTKGLFPEPRQITMSCSCPDWAEMCKHVAASLYGVGARLDSQPALLFSLRGVDAQDLIHEAADKIPAPAASALDPGTSDLAALFGIELADASGAPAARRGRRPKAPIPPTASSQQRKPRAKAPSRKPKRPKAR